VTSVAIDDVRAARTAGRFLIPQGHQSIAMLSDGGHGADWTTATVARRRGFQESMAEAPSSEHCVVESEPGYDGGVRAVTELMAWSSLWSAIFAEYDEPAIGAIRALRLLGIDVPGQVSVIGLDDPYLELVRLLREASEIEHALMVQYLYAANSLKPAYEMVRGFEFASSSDLLGVAVGEMLHLATVNKMLVAVDAAPNLVRQDFPYETDIYPFELNLEPLTRTTLARYVYTEASAEALDPAHPDNADPDKQEFLALLQTELGGVEPNRLGSMSTAWPTATLVHLPIHASWLNQVPVNRPSGERLARVG